jgi:hypothetical protein
MKTATLCAGFLLLVLCLAATTTAQTRVLVRISNLTFVGATVCASGTPCTEIANISFEWNVATGSIVSGSMAVSVSGAISEPYDFASEGPVAGGQGFLWTDKNGDSVSLNTCGLNCGKFPSVGLYSASDITLLCGSTGDSCFTNGFSGAHPVTGTFTVEAPAGTVLFDNFANWTTNSAFLTTLAAASSSPPASFVAPQLSFEHGLQLSGTTEDFQTTGVQSAAVFLAPFTVKARVTPIAGTANPFEVFLVSPDLTEYVTLAANVSPAYHGMWVGAPNIAPLFDLGEQFSPPFNPVLGTTYVVSMSVDDSGVASVSVADSAGKVLGTASGLQSGTGPFYLVLGQRIGLAPAGPQEAVWTSVEVSRPR